jgi:hypothetical protein
MGPLNIIIRRRENFYFLQNNVRFHIVWIRQILSTKFDQLPEGGFVRLGSSDSFSFLNSNFPNL